MARAFGVDVSRYQGKMNWETVAAFEPDVIFAGVRATVSWGYRDSWFQWNWSEAKRVGILRMAYHVVFPGEDVTRQVDNFLGMLGEDLGELPPVLDLELDHGYSTTLIKNNIHAMALQIQSRTGKRPILYSRASWIDQFLVGADWLNDYDWWLATYLSTAEEHPGPPLMPKGVRTYLIHQTTSHGVGIGSESLNMDYDRWNGDREAVYRYAGLSEPPPPAPMTWAQAIDAWARTKGYDGPSPDEGQAV